MALRPFGSKLKEDILTLLRATDRGQRHGSVCVCYLQALKQLTDRPSYEFILLHPASWKWLHFHTGSVCRLRVTCIYFLMRMLETCKQFTHPASARTRPPPCTSSTPSPPSSPTVCWPTDGRASCPTPVSTQTLLLWCRSRQHSSSGSQSMMDTSGLSWVHLSKYRVTMVIWDLVGLT